MSVSPLLGSMDWACRVCTETNAWKDSVGNLSGSVQTKDRVIILKWMNVEAVRIEMAQDHAEYRASVATVFLSLFTC